MTESQTHWAPTLPTSGKQGARVARGTIIDGTDYDSKLLSFMNAMRSCPSFFVRRVSWAFLRPRVERGIILPPTEAPYLGQLPAPQMGAYILANIWPRMSQQFVEKIHFLCGKRRLPTIKQWFYTADGSILPLILSVGNPDLHIREIDGLTKYTLEACANNYLHHIAGLKACKKALRKAWALGQEIGPREYLEHSRYIRAYKRHFPHKKNLVEQGRYVLLWTQSRATGLADGAMIQASIKKFTQTVTLPASTVQMDPTVIREAFGGMEFLRRLDGSNIHLSAGPKACLQVTQEYGGQTGFIKTLTRCNCVVKEYSPYTLEGRDVTPHPVRSVGDLLSWAIHEVLTRPILNSAVRLHAVAEPSKARTITIASYAYQVILGFAAHLWQAAISHPSLDDGLSGPGRNLWKFLYKGLDPQLPTWGLLTEGESPLHSVCSDLSESTDYGNKSVARQILKEMLEVTNLIPGAPMGILQLAKTLFLRKRPVILPSGEVIVTQRAWFMGDRLTKVVLSISHNYCGIKSGIPVWRIVGDDFVGLTKEPKQGEEYFRHLKELDFQVSEADSFISRRLLFYCEEGSLIPESTRDLPAVTVRRRTQGCYLDYPRIRLMIPAVVETDAYSMTNLGRFSLLGKEAKWCMHNAPELYPMFKRAQFIQHLTVPADPDTLCPFTPKEMGGDDSFLMNPNEFASVLVAKSRDLDETLYRISSFLDGTWSPRFVRSERLNEVVHKHHLLVPKISGLKPLLPEGSWLSTTGPGEGLKSMRTSYLENPESTLFRVLRSLYYKDLLRGKEPIVPTFEVDRSHRGGGKKVRPNLTNFLHKWLEEGFTFKSEYDYLVIRNKVKTLDYMNPGIAFGIGRLETPMNREIGRHVVESGLYQNGIESVLKFITEGTELPEFVRSRVSIYIETDGLVMHQVQTLETIPRYLILISQDAKLASRISHLSKVREARSKVILFHPALYLIGRLDELISSLPNGDENTVLEDQGAMSWADSVLFEDGMGPEWVFEGTLDIRTHRRFFGVYQAILKDEHGEAIPTEPVEYQPAYGDTYVSSSTYH